MLTAAGFEPELFAGFPDTGGGWKSRLFRAIRRTAVALHLIPPTMNGKERIKRLLFGKLDPLPKELTDDIGKVYPLVPVQIGQAVCEHKVIYAIGRIAKCN